MKITDKDNYKIHFSGMTISKREASKAGVALFFGLTRSVAFGLAFGIQNKLAIFIIALISVWIGYFGIANRVLKMTGSFQSMNKIKTLFMGTKGSENG